MITSGEVGARFVVVDEASPVLKKLMEQFKALQGIVDKTKLAMKDLVLPPTVESSIGAAAAKMAAMGESSLAVATSFGKMDAAINESVAAATRGAEAMASIARSSAAMAGAGGGASLRQRAAGAASLPGSHTARAGGNIGARIPLPHPLHGGSMHSGFGIGAAVGAFGLYEAAKHGADLSAVEENMRNANWSDTDIAAAKGRAYALGDKYGQPVADVLQSIAEIRAPLGSASEAMSHINTLAAASVILQAQDKKGGGSAASQVYDLTRSAEFRNAINGPDFEKAVGSIVAVDQATAGRVGPDQFLKMIKYMRAAAPGLSDDFLFKFAPEFAQEFGGAGAGTSLSAVYQQAITGQMRTTGLRLLDQLGEVDRTKVDFDKNGRIVKARPGFNKLGSLLKSNPIEYVAQVIADMNSHGITDESTQRDWISMIYGNRNSAQMVMTEAFQLARLKRGADVIGGIHPLQQSADELLKNNPRTDMKAFDAAIGNLFTAAGQTFTPATLGALKIFTNLFNNMRTTEWSKIGINADSNAFGKHFEQWLNGDSASRFHVDSYANASSWDHHSLFWMQERNAAQSANWQAGYRGKDLDSEMGREHSRGMALGNMPAPVVNSNVKVDVKVNLDGRSIAAGVEKYITMENRTSNSTSGHDGSAGETYPDHGYH